MSECVSTITDPPSLSLIHAAHVKVCKDCFLLEKVVGCFLMKSGEFSKGPLLTRLLCPHLMALGGPTSSSLLCSKANSTVGTANWLAKKLTSPGNCEELTLGPGQFPPRMQLRSCLCDHREPEGTHISGLRRYARAYNEKTRQPRKRGRCAHPNVIHRRSTVVLDIRERRV